MGFDMKIKNSGGNEMEKLNFKLSIDMLQTVENICKRHFNAQKNIQEYADFLEDMHDVFQENTPVIVSLIAHEFNQIKSWVENQADINYDLNALKFYGKHIKRIQLALSRPFSYNTLMAAGNFTGDVYYQIIRNDGQSFALDLNHSEVLDFCGELLRVVSHSINPENVDKKSVGAFMTANMSVLSKITGKSFDELLNGKNISVDK